MLCVRFTWSALGSRRSRGILVVDTRFNCQRWTQFRHSSESQREHAVRFEKSAQEGGRGSTWWCSGRECPMPQRRVIRMVPILRVGAQGANDVLRTSLRTMQVYGAAFHLSGRGDKNDSRQSPCARQIYARPSLCVTISVATDPNLESSERSGRGPLQGTKVTCCMYSVSLSDRLLLRTRKRWPFGPWRLPSRNGLLPSLFGIAAGLDKVEK